MNKYLDVIIILYIIVGLIFPHGLDAETVGSSAEYMRSRIYWL